MCGIFLCLDRFNTRPATSTIRDLLRQRGPDSQRDLSFHLERNNCHDNVTSEHKAGDGSDLYVSCVSSVLSLRGDEVVEQPITEDADQLSFGRSSFLCWNGEAWSFAGTAIRGNDSSHIFNTLCHVSRICNDTSVESSHEALAEAISAYAGPFAFVFYDHFSHRLYCGRDFLGRRSLLYKRGHGGALMISSVPDDKDGWLEFEADGLYWVDLNLAETSHELELQKAPYKYCNDDYASLQYSSSSILKLQPSSQVEAIPPKVGLIPESDPVHIIHRLLTYALRSRLLNIPCEQVATSSKRARLAILFSGGIDCTILARLSHDIFDIEEPIDLLNVAFENPRVHAQASKSGKSPFDQCPDRKTAESSLEQLQASCPNRKWRLIRINVPYTEFVAHREKIINLIHPHNTEMDLSIAAALYFAARGHGIPDNQTPYETSARVLLSGLGADELFGGYTRHSTAYNRGGLPALHEELALDISRLGKRNLGRDDRVISHWAKEARYPFLDEYLVHWALSASLSEKCGFGQPCPTDDNGAELDPAKMLLRCLASRIGLGRVANEKKRAVGLIGFSV